MKYVAWLFRIALFPFFLIGAFGAHVISSGMNPKPDDNEFFVALVRSWLSLGYESKKKMESQISAESWKDFIEQQTIARKGK